LGIVHRDGFKLTVVSYAGLVLGYVNRVLLFPNFFSPDQVGLANILINLSAIYAQFSALGLWGIILRFFPFFRDDEKEHHGFLFWASMLMTLGFVLTTLGFLALKPFVVAHYSENAKLLVEYYYYLIPLGWGAVFFIVYDSYLRSLLKGVIPTLINEVVLRLLVTVSISLYAFKVVDFHQFVMIFVGMNCSVAIFILGYTAYLGQLFLKPRMGSRVKRLSKHMVSFGVISILSSAGNALISNIDTLMIAAFIETQVVDGMKLDAMGFVGIYSTIFVLTTVILIPFRAVSKITFPLIAQHWKSKDMVSMEKLYKQVTSVMIVLGLLFFIGLWTNFDNIVSFMPVQFKLGKYVFLFVSLGRLVDLSTGLNGAITMTSKLFRYDLIFTLLFIAVTIFMNYLFIHVYRMGMNGAAIATMITIVSFNVIRVIFVKYNFRMQPFSIQNLWVLIFAGVALGASYLMPNLGNRFLDMAVRSVLVTLIFLGPILYYKIAPDINEFAIKFLKSLNIRLKFLE
jgi:O-antigen/teichoic acid export membrane protein